MAEANDLRSLVCQPGPPRLNVLSANRVIVTVWEKALRDQRNQQLTATSSSDVQNEAGRPSLPKETNIKLAIVKLPETTPYHTHIFKGEIAYREICREICVCHYNVKQELLLVESRISSHVYGFNPVEYSLPPSAAIYMEFNYLGDIDAPRTYRSSLHLMRSSKARFRSACATGDKELIYEAWEGLSIDSQNQFSVVKFPQGRLSTAWVSYFAYERRRKITEMDKVIRRKSNAASAVDFAATAAIFKGMIELVKYFLPLLHNKRHVLRTMLLEICNSVCLSSLTLHRLNREKHLAIVQLLLREMHDEDWKNLLETHPSKLLCCWLKSVHHHWIIMPLAHHVFQLGMSKDDYRSCLDQFRFPNMSEHDPDLCPSLSSLFVQFVNASPIHLRDDVFLNESYGDAWTLTVEMYIDFLRGRSDVLIFAVGVQKCSAWIKQRQWIELHCFLASDILEGRRHQFQLELKRAFFSGATAAISSDAANDSHMQWFQVQKLFKNVSLKIPLHSINYNVAKRANVCNTCSNRIGPSSDDDHDTSDESEVDSQHASTGEDEEEGQSSTVEEEDWNSSGSEGEEMRSVDGEQKEGNPPTERLQEELSAEVEEEVQSAGQGEGQSSASEEEVQSSREEERQSVREDEGQSLAGEGEEVQIRANQQVKRMRGSYQAKKRAKLHRGKLLASEEEESSASEDEKIVATGMGMASKGIRLNGGNHNKESLLSR